MAAAVVEARDNPATESGDYVAMAPSWEMIDDILAGAAAIRRKSTKYLPQFMLEEKASYDRRLQSAPWRPEFENSLNTLAAKPFTKELKLDPESPAVFLGAVVNEETKERRGGLVDDIDGRGNSLHVFARAGFRRGIAYGIEGIYVAYPSVGPQLSVADEKRLGVRPYWVHLHARDIIDLKFRWVGGTAVVNTIRIRESTTVEDGFAERVEHRIRHVWLNADGLVQWQTYLKDSGGKYQPDQNGYMVGMDQVPVALFFSAPVDGNYRVKPPLLDLADVQIELYRALSRSDNILTLTGSPMLVGEGLPPPQPERVVDADGNVVSTKPAPTIQVGPGVVLFAPPQGDGKTATWKYISPDAANIKEVREGVNGVMEDMRHLSMQPTTPKSGNMVATGQAIDASNAHSAVEAWAGAWKDCLAQALVLTCKWLKIPDTVTVNMHTDFDVTKGADELRVIGDMQKRRVISAKTEREEAFRRGTLGPAFDEEQEEQRLAEEAEGLEPEEEIDPVTGKPIKPEPEPDDGPPAE